MFPLYTIYRHWVIELLFPIGHNTKYFHEAYALWQSDENCRKWAEALVPLWLDRTETYTTFDPAAERNSIPTAVWQLAMVKSALFRAKKEPVIQLQLMAEHGSPNFKEIRKKSDKSPGERAWEHASYDLSAKSYISLMNSWAALTKPIRDCIAYIIPEKFLPMPERLDTPETLAWMCQVVDTMTEGLVAGGGIYRADRKPTISEDPAVPLTIRAYQGLNDEDAQALACILLDQHEVWKNAKVDGDRICCDYARSRLSELAAFHKSLTDEIRTRAKKLKLNSKAIDLKPGEDLSHKEHVQSSETGTHNHYITNGVALVKADPNNCESTTKAGHGDAIDLGSRGDLITVFDLDLTSPSLAFLGLQGTRLRICDAFIPDEDGNPTFTKVDFNGNVKAHGFFRSYPKFAEYPDIPEPSVELYVPGRSLESPFEGLYSAGGLGCEYRIGGAPIWWQDPVDVISPASGKLMTFIGQCEHPRGGTAYAFLDASNGIAAVVNQDT